MNPTSGEEVVIRRLSTVAEFDACVALQREVWGFNDTDLVPRRMFVVAHAIGGQVLGAWSGNDLVAYTLAYPGVRDHRPYLHSHMLAVAPPWRNAGLGRRMKLRQRELALAEDIELMEWTFDPLEIKNAWFNLARLGAIVRRYCPNHYGLSSSRLQAGLPTDRLVAEWWLRSPRVAALAAGLPAPAPAVQAHVDVAGEVSAWRTANDPRAAAEQAHIRDELRAAFARGLAVVGYERTGAGNAGAGAAASTPAGGRFLLGSWDWAGPGKGTKDA